MDIIYWSVRLHLIVLAKYLGKLGHNCTYKLVLWLKGTVHLKIKNPHPHVVPKLHDFLSSMELKRRHFEKYIFTPWLSTKWKSMGSKLILLCFTEESHTDLEWERGRIMSVMMCKWWKKFMVSYFFKINPCWKENISQCTV